MPNNTYSSTDWLHKFKEAAGNRAILRRLRAELFHETVEVVNRGEYACDGKLVKLHTTHTTKETVFFKDRSPLPDISGERNLLPETKVPFTTRFNVVESDCVEIASLLKNAGYNVCMLNMANRQNPGGGVLGGAGAQEENIFRRSNLFQSLYQFTGFAGNFGVDRHPEHSYPLDKNFGGIYSKNVTFFRGSENNGYCLLQNPFEISVVSVAAISNPPLDSINDEYFIANELIEPSKEKIRTILRIGGTFNHDCLVLSAFGCGAFRNPPNHMASLFKDVFSEPEFKNRFQLVVFAIIDDHNTWQEHNPQGNILPFFREFNRSPA